MNLVLGHDHAVVRSRNDLDNIVCCDASFEVVGRLEFLDRSSGGHTGENSKDRDEGDVKKHGEVVNGGKRGGRTEKKRGGWEYL